MLLLFYYGIKCEFYKPIYISRTSIIHQVAVPIFYQEVELHKHGQTSLLLTTTVEGVAKNSCNIHGFSPTKRAPVNPNVPV